MKAFGFIFAFYILFLSLQPGLKDMISVKQVIETCSCGSSCEPIEKKQSDKQSEKKDGNENSACNPFQICKNCIAFTGDFAFQNFTAKILFAKPQADNKEKVPPQITLDFWQPPKIV